MMNIVLGSGAAGISAAFHLKKNGKKVIVFEKDNDWGGLCRSFSIDGFRFDRFVHFSFPSNKYTQDLFSESTEFFEHPPVSSNYYHGYWLKHPAQNNLAPLSAEEKTSIILSFINRPQKDIKDIHNYEEWLRCQYGNYFAENFPFLYTRKYWGIEPSKLGIKWVGERMYSPNLEEMIKGSYETQDKNFYYTSLMKYPKTGGFRSILNKARQGLDIEFNKEVISIDPVQNKIYFSDNSIVDYDNLISSIPLPDIIKYIKDVPQNVIRASSELKYTSGYQISLGFNKPDIAKHLWYYIYDEDIPPARVYSPNLKSPDNVPEGCSSLQAEVFFNNDSKIPLAEEVLKITIEKLISMKVFNPSDLILKDIRYEKYANIIFDHSIYKNRKIVLDYLESLKIKSIGRFGKWEYFWSHQAFEDGIII